MSDIIRYHMTWGKDEDGSIYVSPWPSALSGDWVKYEDYARLKAELYDATGHYNCIINKLEAEVERLRASSFVTAVPVEQYERVVKAGDAMAEELIGRYFGNRLVTDWNAAKEGKGQP